jgi:hypothetical protein
MANILACQTLGEMSTPSRAGAEQSRAEQYATRNMADSQPRLLVHQKAFFRKLSDNIRTNHVLHPLRFFSSILQMS